MVTFGTTRPSIVDFPPGEESHNFTPSRTGSGVYGVGKAFPPDGIKLIRCHMSLKFQALGREDPVGAKKKSLAISSKEKHRIAN